jgi:HAD superfamily hydrolase (TIGR01509 family)
MIKAIIFDFDGVIFDTESKKFKDITKALKKRNYELKKKEFNSFIGKKRKFYLQTQIPSKSEEFYTEILNEVRTSDIEKLEEYKIIEGIIELLKFLKIKKIKTAIVTGSNKNFVNKLISLHKIKSYFDLLITGEDFHNSKPNSECYELACKKLKINPNEATVIEDSSAGIQAAKSIKCNVYGLLTYQVQQKLAGADKYFKNHREILKFLQK